MKSETISFITEDKKRIYDIHRAMHTHFNACYYELYNTVVENYYIFSIDAPCMVSLIEVRDHVNKIINR